MKEPNLKYVVLFVLCFVASAVYAQGTVTANQGRPGNQGAWPVTLVGAGGGGGSTATVLTLPAVCTSSSVHKSTTVGVAAGNTPSSQAASRAYLTLCNSLQNTGTPLVKCRMDAVAPVMAAGNPGDVLGIGDCITYPVAAAQVVQCIADAASTYVTSFECVP